MGAQRRIGELLVSEGLVSAAKLEEALERQVVHGGRLGTNLVEMLAVYLDDLGRMLGRQQDLPAALQKHFERSDASVQRLLPPELAARWHVVPLGYTGEESSRVAVAGTDPLPKEALAELEESLGRPVVFAIAPELRILYHLERAYGVERLNRFKRVAKTTADGQERPPTEPGAERRRYVRTLSDEDDETVKPPGALAKIAVKKIAVPASGEIVVEGTLDTFTSGLRAMRQARSRDKVGDVLVETLRSSFHESLAVGMILIIRDETAIGWKGFVRGGSDDLVEATALPLDQPGVLYEPYRSRGPHFGPPEGGGSPLDQRLWRHLGCQAPQEVAVVPVELFGTLACFLYAHCTGELPPETAGGIAELSQGMTAAFHRLVRAAER